MTDPALRILVVDDEPAILRFLRGSLASHATVFEAATGREAISAVMAPAMVSSRSAHDAAPASTVRPSG